MLPENVHEHINNIQNCIYTYPKTQLQYRVRKPKYTLQEVINYGTICYENRYCNQFYTFWGVSTIINMYGVTKSLPFLLDSLVTFDRTNILLSTGVCTLGDYSFDTEEDIFNLHLVLNINDIQRLYIAKKFIQITKMHYGTVVLDVSLIKPICYNNAIKKELK